MSRLLLLTSLAACNVAFPLRDKGPHEEDASIEPDGMVPNDGLLNPPDDDTPCQPPPAFDGYRFQTTPPPFDVGAAVDQFGFFRDAGSVHAIVTAGTTMFEVADGLATLLPISAPQNTSISSPRTAYDGAVVWFQQMGAVSGVFFAARATGWDKKVADLGFIDAEAVEPGAVAFHHGSVRMVVSVRELAGTPTLHEISSPDGVTWTALDTIKFTPSGLGDRNPALSADGCYLVFTASQGSNELRVSPREADGTFQSLIELALPMTAPSFPVLTPDASELWFTSNVGGDIELYRGTP